MKKSIKIAVCKTEKIINLYSLKSYNCHKIFKDKNHSYYIELFSNLIGFSKYKYINTHKDEFYLYSYYDVFFKNLKIFLDNYVEDKKLLESESIALLSIFKICMRYSADEIKKKKKVYFKRCSEHIEQSEYDLLKTINKNDNLFLDHRILNTIHEKSYSHFIKYIEWHNAAVLFEDYIIQTFIYEKALNDLNMEYFPIELGYNLISLDDQDEWEHPKYSFMEYIEHIGFKYKKENLALTYYLFGGRMEFYLYSCKALKIKENNDDNIFEFFYLFNEKKIIQHFKKSPKQIKFKDIIEINFDDTIEENSISIEEYYDIKITTAKKIIFTNFLKNNYKFIIESNFPELLVKFENKAVLDFKLIWSDLIEISKTENFDPSDYVHNMNDYLFRDPRHWMHICEEMAPMENYGIHYYLWSFFDNEVIPRANFSLSFDKQHWSIQIDNFILKECDLKDFNEEFNKAYSKMKEAILLKIKSFFDNHINLKKNDILIPMYIDDRPLDECINLLYNINHDEDEGDLLF